MTYVSADGCDTLADQANKLPMKAADGMKGEEEVRSRWERALFGTLVSLVALPGVLKFQTERSYGAV